jgi:hypothetical protein
MEDKMKFDVNRLARLSGLESSTSLNEASNRSYHDDSSLSKESEIVHGKGQLSEREDFETHKGEKNAAGDDAFRGMDKGDKADVNEMSDDEALDSLVQIMETDGVEEMHHSEMNEDEDYSTKKSSKRKKRGAKGRPFWGDKAGDHDGPDEMMYRSNEGEQMVQLDEEIIRKELLEMRKEKIQETALRRAIRSEIKDVVKDLDVYASTNWLYGDNKPSRSRTGTVTMGTVGVGFKGYKG